MPEDKHLTDSFRKQLDQEYTWPAEYLFKFIVPKEQEKELLRLFINKPVSTRHSKNRNYVSVTSKAFIHSSEEVIAMYQAAYVIKGIISL